MYPKAGGGGKVDDYTSMTPSPPQNKNALRSLYCQHTLYSQNQT